MDSFATYFSSTAASPASGALWRTRTPRLFDQLIVKASTVDAQVFDDFQKRIDDLRIELRAPFDAQIDRHFACGNAFRQGRLCVGEL